MYRVTGRTGGFTSMPALSYGLNVDCVDSAMRLSPQCSDKEKLQART